MSNDLRSQGVDAMSYIIEIITMCSGGRNDGVFGTYYQDKEGRVYKDIGFCTNPFKTLQGAKNCIIKETNYSWYKRIISDKYCYIEECGKEKWIVTYYIIEIDENGKRKYV